MNLQEKSNEVRLVFQELESETKAFIEASQLGCISGCGQCCANPKVSASVLEFLPFAFDLFDKGKAEKVLEIFENTGEEEFCIIYKSLSEDGSKGFCSDYQNRGLICRLFGSSSRRNKSGDKEIITCKKIKEQKKELYETAVEEVKKDMPVPSSSGYYNRLYNIDFQLTDQQMPINLAIKNALLAVLTYKYYQGSEDTETTESF